MRKRSLFGHTVDRAREDQKRRGQRSIQATVTQRQPFGNGAGARYNVAVEGLSVQGIYASSADYPAGSTIILDRTGDEFAQSESITRMADPSRRPNNGTVVFSSDVTNQVNR